MVVPHHQICGHQYQEASYGPAVHPPCECGTDSIGTCKRCRRRICGMHSQSQLSDGYRVCAWCLAEDQYKAEQLKQQQEGAEARELLQEIIQYAKQLRTELAHDDPCTALVRLTRHAYLCDGVLLNRANVPGRFGYRSPQFRGAAIFGGWPDPPSDADIVDWFVRHPKLGDQGPGLGSVLIEMPGRWRRRQARAWIIPTRRCLGPDTDWQRVAARYPIGDYHIAITETGEVRYQGALSRPSWGWDSPPPAAKDHPYDTGPATDVLSAWSLCAMEGAIGLPQLPLPAFTGRELTFGRKPEYSRQGSHPRLELAIEMMHALDHEGERQ